MSGYANTNGLPTGMTATEPSGTSTAPVGETTPGRVPNVIGQPADDLGPVNSEQRYPIHRHAPTLDEQSAEMEMFDAGIKVTTG